MIPNETYVHHPVMLQEAIASLNIKPGKTYLDATIGAGGHSREILKKGGLVIGLDTDPQAIAYLRENLKDPGLQLICGNFVNLTELVRGVTAHQVSGVLMDLGTSARQIKDPAYGMSFMQDSKLDMRISPSLAVTAKDLVNGLTEKELYVLFTKYAQEQRARAISAAIVRARALKPIETTTELAALVERVYGGRQSKLHPATKVFQALRIAVNDELNNLIACLPQALNLLESKGRLVVISFHEGEDRVVKQFIHSHSAALKDLTQKPLMPTPAELNTNPRSRSAKLRLIEKI